MIVAAGLLPLRGANAPLPYFNNLQAGFSFSAGRMPEGQMKTSIGWRQTTTGAKAPGETFFVWAVTSRA
jgi:hypothetical protein